MKKYFKLNYNKLFLVIGFLLSAFTCSLILSSTYRFYSRIVDNNHLNKNYMYVTYETKDNMSLMAEINLFQQKGIKNMITPQLTSTFSYGNDDIENDIIGALPGFNIEKYANVKGRNFTYDELNGNKKIAIIGSDLEKYTIKINSKDYIKVFDDYYEVIGVIQNSNFYANITIVPIKSLYFVNHKYERFYQMVSNKEIEKLKSLDNIQIEPLPQQSVILFLIQHVSSLKDSLFEFALGVINIIFFSLFFSYDIKKRIAIMKVLGAKNVHVYKTIFWEISVVSIVGIAGGLILSKFTIDFMNKANPFSYKPLDIYNILITGGVIYLISIAVSIIVLFNTIKSKILKEIR